MIIDIIPCVVVTSLETDAFVAVVAYFDMLLVKEVTPARGRRRRYSRNSCYYEKEKRGPRLCISKFRSNEFYSTESWRIGIERSGGTHHEILSVHLVQNWNSGKKRAIWSHYPKKVNINERNPCAPGFEEQPLEETSRQADCTSKIAWNL